MDPNPPNFGPGNPAQSPERVELKVFSDPNSADLAKASLLARGIECWLTADDCGGMYPFMDAAHGVKLFVRRSDSDAALALLAADRAAAADLSPPEETTTAAAATQITPPRIKLSLPQLIAGIVTGILLCLLYQWTATFGTKIYRYDWDGDGKSDEICVYHNGQYVESSFDRNFDGQLDYWNHFDSTGKRILSKADDNFDGVPDVTWNYTNGVLASSRLDTDFNGTPDVTHTFKHDLVVQSDWRPNGTNIITLRQLFRHGVLTEESRDTNMDGSFDVTIRYDAFQNVIQSNAFRLLSPSSP